MHVHHNKNNPTVKYTCTSNNHLNVTKDLKQVPCGVKSQSSSHKTVQRPNHGGCDSPVTVATQYVIPNAKGRTCKQQYIGGVTCCRPLSTDSDTHLGGVTCCGPLSTDSDTHLGGVTCCRPLSTDSDTHLGGDMLRTA